MSVGLTSVARGEAAPAPAERVGVVAWSRLAPLTILLLALGLRLWGIGWQLPWEFHPDEGHYVWKAVDMVESGNLNPKYFRNPSLYTELLAIQYKLLDLAGLTSGLPGGAEALQAPSIYVLLGRLTTALLGAATVLLVIRLGVELLGRPAGLLGGLLLAVAFLHVRDAHYATNDVPATFFLTASVLFSARLARSGRNRDLLLAALFGGLAASTKYNAGFFVAPLLVGWWAGVMAVDVTDERRRTKDEGRRGKTSVYLRPSSFVFRLLPAGLVSLLAYLAGTPFTVLAWPAFRDDFLVQQRFAKSGWEGQGPEPVWLLYGQTLVQGLGWVAVGLALVGLVLMARRRPWAAALLGAYPLVYLVFMLGVKLFFARFAVTVMPFLCLLAAYGALEPARLGRPRLRPALLASLALATLAQPLWNNLQHHRIVTQMDTRVLAYAWLDANLPPNARLVADDYSVRDRRPRADLPDRGRFDLDLVNALSERDLATYRQQGYRYAVASSFQYQRFPGKTSTYADLDRDARLLAVFTPTRDGSELPFDIEDLYTPFDDLGRHERPGPTIKIYDLGER